MMLFSLKGNVITSLKNVGYHISAFSAQSSPHIKICFFSPIGFPRGYAIGIPSTLGFPRYHGFSHGPWSMGFPRSHLTFSPLDFQGDYLFIYLSIYLFIYLFIYLYIYLFIYLSIYMFIYLSIYLFIYLYVYLFIYLSIYIFICLSNYLVIYLSIYLFIF